MLLISSVSLLDIRKVETYRMVKPDEPVLVGLDSIKDGCIIPIAIKSLMLVLLANIENRRVAGGHPRITYRTMHPAATIAQYQLSTRVLLTILAVYRTVTMS